MGRFEDALDRYITGNYGEDQLRCYCANCGKCYYDDEPEESGNICPECNKIKKVVKDAEDI